MLESFDQTNIAKNKQYGIEAPAPITSLQSLLQAVISPKIAAITSKFGALSGGSIGGGGLSIGGGGASAGGDPTDQDNAELSSDGSQGSAGGSGGILSSVLKLSGPILSSSSSSAKGGQPVPVSSDESDE